jgi:hypothetical protein
VSAAAAQVNVTRQREIDWVVVHRITSGECCPYATWAERRDAIRVLRNRGMLPLEIQQHTGYGQSMVSKNIKDLRETGEVAW